MQFENAAPAHLPDTAVIGMAVRFPRSWGTEAFWRLMIEGDDALAAPRPQRPENGTPATYDRPLGEGGLLEDIDQFDPAPFGLSPREAAWMDPQQRLLLEVGWRALEDAGIDPTVLAGSRTGVFTGIATGDYKQLALSNGTGLDAHAALGTSEGIAAARLSHTLDLRGPSLSIDAACASALLALHQARLSLAMGDCELAIVGGVNVVVGRAWTKAFASSGLLSPTGRCRPFDASADGYVRSEGCGVVVMRNLKDARAAGQRVRGVVRGSATGHSGRTDGIARPSSQAQAGVVRRALQAARLQPADLDYVEAHGTGTVVGDPIELAGLQAVFAGERASSCPIGSVKGNIGHTEAASGVAGIVKAILCLEQGRLPRSLHFAEPHAALANCPDLRVVQEPEEFGEPGRLRRIGVSSFGFGGSTAHVVLEQAPNDLTVTAKALPERKFARVPYWLPQGGLSAPHGAGETSPLYQAVAEVASVAPESLQPGHLLGRDLGFDSLMIVELEQRLGRQFPGFPDHEQVIRGDAKIEDLLRFCEGLEPKSTERWTTLAELTGAKERNSYLIEGVREEVRKIRDLSATAKELVAVLDVENEYSGTSRFHLSQMACYAFLVQMVQGFLCHRSGRTKRGFGMPRLHTIEMHWNRMIRSSHEIRGTVRNTAWSVAEGVLTIEMEFDVGDGAVTGCLCGWVPLEDPASQIPAAQPNRNYATLSELFGLDPSSTYTGGGFHNERLSIEDLKRTGKQLTALLDVENDYSDSPAFHLTQRTTYTALVQVMLGYVCAKRGCRRADLGMPVLEFLHLNWREMVPFAKGIRLEVTETDSTTQHGFERMELAFRIGNEHGSGTLIGRVPQA